MKSILISIKPEYVGKILNGEKTIEIRKTKPNIELPCKVYIYCTNGYMLYDLRNEDYLELKKNCTLDITHKSNKYLSSNPLMLNRRVVAEFTLNEINCLPSIKYKANGAFYQYNKVSDEILKKSCLTQEQILNYTNGKDLYAWHIEDSEIYDKPKELSEFKKRNKCHYANYEDGCCFECCTFYDLGDCDGKYSKIERPPQSWMFVESLEDM